MDSFLAQRREEFEKRIAQEDDDDDESCARSRAQSPGRFERCDEAQLVRRRRVRALRRRRIPIGEVPLAATADDDEAALSSSKTINPFDQIKLEARKPKKSSVVVKSTTNKAPTQEATTTKKKNGGDGNRSSKKGAILESTHPPTSALTATTTVVQKKRGRPPSSAAGEEEGDDQGMRDENGGDDNSSSPRKKKAATTTAGGGIKKHHHDNNRKKKERGGGGGGGGAKAGNESKVAAAAVDGIILPPSADHPVDKSSSKFTFRGSFSIGNVTAAGAESKVDDARRRRRRRGRRAAALVAASAAAAAANSNPGASSGSLIATIARYATTAAQSFSECNATAESYYGNNKSERLQQKQRKLEISSRRKLKSNAGKGARRNRSWWLNATFPIWFRWLSGGVGQLCCYTEVIFIVVGCELNDGRNTIAGDNSEEPPPMSRPSPSPGRSTSNKGKDLAQKIKALQHDDLISLCMQQHAKIKQLNGFKKLAAGYLKKNKALTEQIAILAKKETKKVTALSEDVLSDEGVVKGEKKDKAAEESSLVDPSDITPKSTENTAAKLKELQDKNRNLLEKLKVSNEERLQERADYTKKEAAAAAAAQKIIKVEKKDIQREYDELKERFIALEKSLREAKTALTKQVLCEKNTETAKAKAAGKKGSE
eukprot:jgi/Bigna1/83421/fgenesh1_pg.108_\